MHIPTMEAIQYAQEYVAKKSEGVTHAYEVTSESPDASHPNRVLLTLKKHNEVMANIMVEKAKDSDFQRAASLSNTQVFNTSVIHAPSVMTLSMSKQDMAVLLYFAIRQARMWQGQNFVMLLPEETHHKATCSDILKLASLEHTPSVCMNEETYEVFAQRIKYGSHYANEAADEAGKAYIQSQYINEILLTFEEWLSKLYAGSWFQSILTESISKQQYIWSLFNMHQFVKHTTRLAARCVAISENRELRNHYINHLRGEVNHEVIIETDLQGLDADVDYLINNHVPHYATARFIVLQESITGYKQDPILMLACPFVAEGMTANIPVDFLNHLNNVIRSWGIENPEYVSRFISSHMKADGGVDGHWLRVIMMIHKFVRTENQMQEFLTRFKLAMVGYAHGLNASIDDLALWCSSPAEVSALQTAEAAMA